MTCRRTASEFLASEDVHKIYLYKYIVKTVYKSHPRNNNTGFYVHVAVIYTGKIVIKTTQMGISIWSF